MKSLIQRHGAINVLALTISVIIMLISAIYGISVTTINARIATEESSLIQLREEQVVKHDRTAQALLDIKINVATICEALKKNCIK
jgi:hypothetical protein